MSRSFLFVPADSQRKLEHAIASSADALILDLEDSVTASMKSQARSSVAHSIAQLPSHQQGWVRVNALDTGLLLTDLVAVVPARPFGIVLPKCSGRESLLQVANYLDALEAQSDIRIGSTQILAIVTETAKSMFELGSYAAVTSRLWGVAWGGEDLAADIGALNNRIQGRYTEPYRMARSLSLFAAAAAGVKAIDTVCVDITDDDVLREESKTAYRDGFTGKMAIHPRQNEIINKAFSADESQLKWAQEVVSRFEQNPHAGAFNLNGQMIDQPHLRLARRLIESSP